MSAIGGSSKPTWKSRTVEIALYLAFLGLTLGAMAVVNEVQEQNKASRGVRAVFIGMEESCHALDFARKSYKEDLTVDARNRTLATVIEYEAYRRDERLGRTLNPLGRFTVEMDSVSPRGNFRMSYLPSKTATTEDKALVEDALKGAVFTEKSEVPLSTSCTNLRGGKSFYIGKHYFEYEPRAAGFSLANFVRP